MSALLCFPHRAGRLPTHLESWFSRSEWRVVTVGKSDVNWLGATASGATTYCGDNNGAEEWYGSENRVRKTADGLRPRHPNIVLIWLHRKHHAVFTTVPNEPKRPQKTPPGFRFISAPHPVSAHRIWTLNADSLCGRLCAAELWGSSQFLLETLQSRCLAIISQSSLSLSLSYSLSIYSIYPPHLRMNIHCSSDNTTGSDGRCTGGTSLPGEGYQSTLALNLIDKQVLQDCSSLSRPQS